MPVLEGHVVRRLSIQPPGGDDRYLGLEADEFFDNDGLPAHRGPDGRNLRGCADLVLALAVVAERRGLDDGWRADRGHSSLELGQSRRGRERHRGKSVCLQELFLANPVLGDEQRPGSRPDRDVLLHGANGLGGHVLEL